MRRSRRLSDGRSHAGPRWTRERAGTLHGCAMSGLPNSYCDVHFTSEPGLLVLFPHWLEHFVEPHDNDESHVMVAFDAIEPASGF